MNAIQNFTKTRTHTQTPKNIYNSHKYKKNFQIFRLLMLDFIENLRIMIFGKFED